VFAFVAEAGNAILFVSFGAALVVVGTYSLGFAAHCYMVVVEGTAAGIDRIDWPDDPITDWLPRALWLVVLALVWLALAGVIDRILARAGVEAPPGVRFFALAAGGLWLCFPISLLSALAAASRWIILSPRVLFRLPRILPSVLIFYLVTALLVGLVGLGLYVGLMTRAWVVLPLACVLGGAVLLIHARLVGRLAWLLHRLEHGRTAAKSAKPAKRKATATPRKKRNRPPRAVSVSDPWAAPEPEAEEPPPEPSLPVYRVAEEPAEEARPAPLLDDPEPYPVSDEPAPTADKPPPHRTALEENKVQRELELRTRREPAPPPSPMFSGVYSFPVYSTTHRHWFWLTVWALATVLLLRAALAFLPR
jgi:hypothetical protein